MLTFKGKVLNLKEDDRELLQKDGVTKVTRHIVKLSMMTKDGMIVLSAFDPKFEVPKIGQDWETPEIRRYENFDSFVGNVLV